MVRGRGARTDRFVVVDTDVLIDYFAGVSLSAEAVERLLKQDRLAVTALTLFELACGTQTEEQRRDLERLILAARALDLDAAAALQAGAVYRRLKARGELLPVPDLLIAGCCLAVGWPLLTRNVGHFRRVPGLELWEPAHLLDSGPG